MGRDPDPKLSSYRSLRIRIHKTALSDQLYCKNQEKVKTTVPVLLPVVYRFFQQFFNCFKANG
jgi:hypothetical protein